MVRFPPKGSLRRAQLKVIFLLVTDHNESINGDEVALEVGGVRFTYPARRGQKAREALKGVSVSVPPGQRIALLGPNGSGKSTLMKIICGMLPPDSGTFRVFGQTSLDEIRRSLGVVFQSEGLDPHMTVYENLRDQASLYGLSRRDARDIIEEELEKAGLADRRGSLVKTLSKGLARRVDLCRALLHKPRLILLDEPTVGLDPLARERFLDTLETRWRKENLTILMSTHLIDEADRLDRVVFLHQGEIVADDPPAKLRQQLGRQRMTVLDGQWTPPASESEKWQQCGVGWWRPLGDDRDEAASLASELALSGVPCTIAPPTLADVFEKLTGEIFNSETKPSEQGSDS